MKKIVIFLLSLLFIGLSFADSKISITMDGPLKGGEVLKLNINDLPENTATIDLYVGDIKFGKKSKYEFVVPENFKINSLNKTIKIIVTKQDGTKDTYFYDKFFPEFVGINLLDLKGGKKAYLLGHFKGNCKLILSNDEVWNLSKDNNKYFTTIPKKIYSDIEGGYVLCDGLSSKYVKFNIPTSPEILYVVTKNKKPIKPGSTMILEGKNIKLSENNDIKLFIKGQEVKYNLISNNKLEFDLPYSNFNNAKIKITRDDFESNEINFSIKKSGYVKKVSLNSKNGKNYFRLYDDFDFGLGRMEAYFGRKRLNILGTGQNKYGEYIDVSYPEYYPMGERKFACSYYIEPNYFYVKIGGIVSNKFFYTPDSNLYIKYALKPRCEGKECYIQLYLNKPLDRAVFYINGKSYNYSSISTLFKVYTNDDFIKKGYIQVVDNFCTRSQKYYFDYEEDFKPLIKYIKSSSKFKSQAKFEINGDRLTNDGSLKPIKFNLKFSPDVLDKQDLRYGYTNINGFIKYGAKDNTKVRVIFSTRHGSSNGVNFVVGGKSKYLGNPVIYNILYPNGGEGGKKAIIKGIGFSERCNENKIYFKDKVIYPDDCTYTSLEFTIPEDISANTIYLDINGNRSKVYKTNAILGSSIVKKEFNIDGIDSNSTVFIGKDSLNREFEFKIKNTITDIYVSYIKFNIDNIDFLPIDNAYLSINYNDKKYYWSLNQHKVISSNEKNTAFIKKTKNGYELTFRGVYIPFSTKNIKAKLVFKLADKIPNGKTVNIIFPKQQIYYNNIFGSDKINKITNENTFSNTYKIVRKEDICFDSNKNFEHCSLILKGEKLKSEVKNDKPSNQNQQTTSKPVQTKQEKIAKRLTQKKMIVLNKIIRKYIVKWKKQYWHNKAKLKYIIEMYRGYKVMESNTSDSFDKKVEYVNGLIYFAQNYFKFKKVK